MSEIDWITTNADKVGPTALLLFALLSFYKKWIVLGWVYQEVEDERDTLRHLADQRAGKIEEKLDRLESERWVKHD